MSRDAPPTIAQVYAIAVALCARAGEPFPESRADASGLIVRLQREFARSSDERPIAIAAIPGREALD